MKTFKTPKGTELPLLNLKGKDYLAVQPRLVWFREEHPDWGIQTHIVTHTEDYSAVQATIIDDKGRIIAQGLKSESAKGFPDHLEKAESGAIGRALGFVGYGTLFATELDEGHRLADSPQTSLKPTIAIQQSLASKVNHANAITDKTKAYVQQTVDHVLETLDKAEKNPTVISEPQRIRLWAICKKANWDEKELKMYLKDLKITSSKEIPWTKYDSICKYITNNPFT